MDNTQRERQAVLNAYRALDEKFGKDIIIMDISGLSSVADYFLLVTGGSTLQIQALAAAAEESLTRDGYQLMHSEGLRSANWALLDFGDVIVHLFDKESRPFYNLERVWGDAKIINP